jgi:tetratricopeptide (TPR) repeat protein
VATHAAAAFAPSAPAAVPGTAAVLAPPGAAAAAPAGMTVEQRITFFARRAAEQPADFLSLTQLAIAHAERARTTHDLAGYERASEAIERALGVAPENPATLRVRASIAYALHDFAAAVEDAERVLDRLPDDASALAVLGDARLEVGDVAAARAAYERLTRISPGPALDVRLARLAWLTGDGAGAVDLARGALAAAPTEERGFYAYALGEYRRLTGDARGAREAFELALSTGADDLGALVGLARVDAWEGRVEDALARLDDAAAMAPQPEILALTADLHRLAGDVPSARRAERLVRDIGSPAASATRGCWFTPAQSRSRPGQTPGDASCCATRWLSARRSTRSIGWRRCACWDLDGAPASPRLTRRRPPVTIAPMHICIVQRCRRA